MSDRKDEAWIERHLRADLERMGYITKRQVRIGSAVADLVAVHRFYDFGTEIIVEIKSEFDSPARLERQLGEYRKASVNVALVTTVPEKYRPYLDLDHVQMWHVLSDGTILKSSRPTYRAYNNLDVETMLGMLPYRSALRLIEALTGATYSGPNNSRYAWMLEQLSPQRADAMYVYAWQELQAHYKKQAKKAVKK